MRTKQQKRNSTAPVGVVSPSFWKLGLFCILHFLESDFVLSHRSSWGIDKRTTSAVCDNEDRSDRCVLQHICGHERTTAFSKLSSDHIEKSTRTALSCRGGYFQNSYDIEYESRRYECTSNNDLISRDHYRSDFAEHESDINDEWHEDDLDDDGIDDNSGFEASASSSSTLSTMFYPPVMKCTDIAFALRLTCNVNDRLHKLATQANKQNMNLLVYNHHMGSALFHNAFTTSGPLMAPRSTTYTPQGRLRGGSISYNIQNHLVQYSYQQRQYTNEIRNHLSSNQVLARKMHPVGTFDPRVNDSLTARSMLRSPFTSFFANGQVNFEIEPYLLFLVGDVFDIVPLPGATTSSRDRSHLLDLKEQQSRLEMALAMIYLDRACSVETPKTNSRSNSNPIPSCPPCTKATVHRLVLTSLLLSISSVRGIPIEDIIHGKLSQLCVVMYGHPANEPQHRARLVRDLKHMVQLMRDALGDGGIHVTPNQMKNFRRMWESSFGSSES